MIAPTTPTAFMCKKNFKMVIKIDILEKGKVISKITGYCKQPKKVPL